MAPGISLDDRSAWDDTALIRSWNEALDEYKKYHSIQAQGKRLEDVLSEDELRQLREEHGDLIEEVETRSGDADPNNDADLESAEPVVVKANSEGRPAQVTTQAEEHTASGHQEQSRVAESPLPQQETPLAASMPQAILGTVQDDNLKNLMMSWYYAGYYTGLHTSQQQTASKAPQKE